MQKERKKLHLHMYPLVVFLGEAGMSKFDLDGEEFNLGPKNFELESSRFFLPEKFEPSWKKKP